MNEYGAKAYDPYVHTEPDRPDPRTGLPYVYETDQDPDRTFLGILRRELMTAAEREKEARASLIERQGKADALTREREAIERAIKAYQHQESPNMRADR